MLLVFSIVLFALYKLARKGDTDKKESKLGTYLDQNNFLLSIDVDGAKLMIFLNTVFMNNFSISKKLSHNDAYISHTQQKFIFEYRQIFARKPLKKIMRNGISKYLRIVVAKVIMKY